MKYSIATAVMCFLGMLVAGCSSLSDYETLPSITLSDCDFDLSDKSFPVIVSPYCIRNPLDIDADIARVHFSYRVNGLTVYEKERELNKSVDRFGDFCENYRVSLDAVNDPKVASTILNTMLNRTCEVNAVMYFDDREISPVSGSFKKVVK